MILCSLLIVSCGGAKEAPKRGVERLSPPDVGAQSFQKKSKKRRVTRPRYQPLPEPSPVSFRRPLKVVTMNIKWFGLGGGLYNRPEDEGRHSSLKHFFATHYQDVDVFLFQEIVFIDQLKPLLPQYKCHSYRHGGRKHQFVALCVRSPLRFKRSPFDNNFKWETVALGSRGLRPALHGVIVHPQEGPYLYIVGLHLKAGARKSVVRRRQWLSLIELLKLVQKLPVLVAGDVNTFGGHRGRPHETEGFAKALSNAGLKIKHATAHRPVTSLGRHGESLDHIWVSSKLTIVKEPEVFEVCARGYRHYTRQSYRREISDHCPVSIAVQF